MEDNRMVSFSLGGMAFEYDDNKNQINIKKQIPEQTKHDRGNPCKRFCCHADNGNKFIAALCIFHQINRCEDTGRHREQQRHCRNA